MTFHGFQNSLGEKIFKDIQYVFEKKNDINVKVYYKAIVIDIL